MALITMPPVYRLLAVVLIYRAAGIPASGVQRVKQNKLDIVAISETLATENIWEAELHMDGFVTYRRDNHEIRKVRGGGVIIYISNGFSSYSYEELNSLQNESVWIKITEAGQKISQL